MKVNVVKVDDPRQQPAERHRGVLVEFEPAKYQGFVRFGELKIHVTTATRGVLLPDGKIDTQINGHRLEPIAPNARVEFDFVLDREGGNPFITAWAPVVKSP